MQEAFATVRARGFLVVLVAVVGIVGGLIYGHSKTTDSSSIARLQLQPLSENSTVISVGVSARSARSPPTSRANAFWRSCPVSRE